METTVLRRPTEVSSLWSGVPSTEPSASPWSSVSGERWVVFTVRGDSGLGGVITDPFTLLPRRTGVEDRSKGKTSSTPFRYHRGSTLCLCMCGSVFLSGNTVI